MNTMEKNKKQLITKNIINEIEKIYIDRKDSTSNTKKLSEKDIDAYKIMGLELNTEWPIIQKKFKTLVKKFHPDKNAGNKQFEDKLKKITLADSH